MSVKTYPNRYFVIPCYGIVARVPFGKPVDVSLAEALRDPRNPLPDYASPLWEEISPQEWSQSDPDWEWSYGRWTHYSNLNSLI